MKFLSGMFATVSLAAMSLTMQPVAADGTLVIASSNVPRHLNGAVQSGIATAVPSTQIFASLVRYDEGWEPSPYLAESWSVSDDGLSVTMNLVKDATFHDGTPITSADVAFSLTTVRDNHPFSSMFAPLETVETPDAHTAILKLNKPHPALMLALSPALAPIIPKHVYGDGQDIKTHPANSAPVGSGPFMLEEFTPGESIIMTKNPNFFLDGLPVLDEVIVRIIQDPAALLIAMENGDADVYPFMGTSQEIRRLKDADNLEVTEKGYAGIGPINWLAFNTASEKLSDVRVRQAIAYAVDRDFITNALHRGVSTPQRGPIIESSPFFDETIPAYDVDLDKAKALMAEAGYGDGMELTIDYIPGPREQQQSLAEYMVSQLAEIGIDVTVRAAPDVPTWASRVGGHDC